LYGVFKACILIIERLVYWSGLIGLSEEVNMREEIGSYEAKTRLPEVLRRVEAGDTFTITNRGRAVADIVPSKVHNHDKILATINNILVAKKHIMSDKDLLELKEEGRK